MIRKTENKLTRLRRGFTLVELMVVVAIIGILAAIAIPAFLRYINSTRVAEAELLMDWITKGAVSYYSSEQKYSGPSGDQPWHLGTAAPGHSDSYGMPVAERAFPGINYEFNTDDGEGTFINCATAPSGGAKTYGDMLANTDTLAAVLAKLKLGSPCYVYFQYGYSASGVTDAAEAEISAVANFKSGGSCHTHLRRIRVVDAEPAVGPVVLTNEFE